MTAKMSRMTASYCGPKVEVVKEAEMDEQDRVVRWAERLGPPGQSLRQAVVLAVALALVPAPLAWADRTQLKPGWNMFSPQQDVEVGQQVSSDAEKQVPMMKDSRVDNYLNSLGHRLQHMRPATSFRTPSRP